MLPEPLALYKLSYDAKKLLDMSQSVHNDSIKLQIAEILTSFDETEKQTIVTGVKIAIYDTVTESKTIVDIPLVREKLTNSLVEASVVNYDFTDVNFKVMDNTSYVMLMTTTYSFGKAINDIFS